MRVFICDDEALAVRRLTSMLSRVANIEVVGSTSDPREALEIIHESRPELLMLDIDMPELDGFDIVEALARSALEPIPLVAFLTAHCQFAPQAFESAAIDFLPKPIRLGRLELTLDRAREAISLRQAKSRLDELEKNLGEMRTEATLNGAEHVWVRRRGEVVRVDLNRVGRVVAEGPYVRLHLEETTYLHRSTITAIGLRLGEERYSRVHRSHIVRHDLISSIRRTNHGGGELVLSDGELIPIGRKYADCVPKLLNGHSREVSH